ncbi:MAG: nicotinate (nicotinamide) nucleotide adenylyltransferase [Planctomycetota bacterium]
MKPESGPNSGPLGLYGGSFNPVHRGHLEVARRAREAFGLERVLFIPAARPPHKLDQTLAGPRDRVAMLELALADLEWAAVEPLELDRDGPSYSVHTAEALLAADPGLEGRLYWILGGDNLPGLPGWYQVERLLELVFPIVLRRAGDGADLIGPLAGRLSPRALERLAAGVMDLPPTPGRSSELREALIAGWRGLADLPAGVETYVLERGLYGTGDSR